jgi:ABC-2 type transport system permease protein
MPVDTRYRRHPGRTGFRPVAGDRGDPAVGATAVTTAFLVIGLFPVYYNVLSQFVSRRDELVLKRLRTGETRDAELLVSIALPGAVSALAIAVLAVPISQLFDQRLPINPFVYAGAAVLAVIMFSAFAYWTAAWTRSAEAAQLTSMPIILLATFGPFGAQLAGDAEAARRLIEATPGAALSELVRVGWFGLDGVDAETTTLSFAETWSHAAQPLLVIVAWTLVACALAARSMRWEPPS